MAQFVRPISDITNAGVWTTTPLWSDIDEGGAGDGTVVISDTNPIPTESFVCDGSTVTDPEVSTGHILRARWAKNATGGADHRGTLQLRQGYVSEVSQGTQIATLVGSVITDTALLTDTYTLTGTEADSIGTDYSDLSLRAFAAKSGGGAGRAFKIDFIELETPDAGPGGLGIPLVMHHRKQMAGN